MQYTAIPVKPSIGIHRPR